MVTPGKKHIILTLSYIKQTVIFMLTIYTLLLVSACGGGGGGAGDATSLNSGTFIDAPVQGLDYETDTQNGTTNSQGTFRYETGEEITFSIGSVILGTVFAKSLITPLDLVSGAEDETDPTVTSMLRLLQSIDADGNLDNGITITPEIADEVSGRPINFYTGPETFENELADLIETLNNQGAFTGGTPRSPRTAEEAQAHFRQVTDEPGDPAELTAVITVAPDTVNILEPVVFDASGSTGPIIEYAWDFGDGTTGSGIEISHTFAETGTYLVTLTVSEEGGKVASLTLEIQVIEPSNKQPLAIISADPTTGETPLRVLFVSSESFDPDGKITSYRWDFGDAKFTIGMNAFHTYQEPGTYTATLTLTDDGGATTKATIEIIATPPPPNQAPTASFTTTPESGEAPLIVTFNASGSSDPDGSIESYSWNFGDGNTGSGMTTTHNFAEEGTYLVTLTVIDNDGAAADTTADIIVTPRVNEAPTASFTATPVKGGAPLGVVFNAAGSSDPDGSIETYIWNFGDGQSGSGVSADHTFTEPGNYTATLIVTDDMGATATVSQEIIVIDLPNQPPIAKISTFPSSRTGEAPFKIILSGFYSTDSDGTISKYEWRLGDGSSAAGLRKTHIYSNPGSYNVVLTITDDDGAQDTASTTVNVTEAINDPPTATFIITPDTGEAPLDVLFDATASSDPDGTIENYAWIFGDGAVDNSNTRRPTHTYTDPGTYLVRLTVTDNEGATGTKTLTLNVSEQTNQPPTASFTATPNTGTAPLDVELNATGSSDPDGSIAQYFWNLGNGETATTPIVNLTYNDANIYRVRLTVTDNEGVTDTASLDINVTAPTTYNISGSVSAPSNTAVDNDVNDPTAPYSGNNTPDTAQEIPNPVILGGYANVAGSGPSGRSYAGGDVFDYYQVELAAGQQISLNIANQLCDLDLAYINNDTGETDLSAGTTQFESLTVPSNGSYTITVQALSGAANYTLTIAQASPAALGESLAIGNLQLQSEFKPGDIIIQFTENAEAGHKPSLMERAAAIGLTGKGGKPGRAMLFGIGSDNKSKVFKLLGIIDEKHPLLDRLDSIEQHKMDTIKAIKALRKRPDVLYAEPNYRRSPMALPNDSHYSLQWHYPFINLPRAWDITTGSSNVVVAVIDTGVLLNHPDLQNQLTAGYDFISDIVNSNDGNGRDPNPDDPGDNPSGGSSFHGTHVAGTIAARTNNSQGVTGIAWNTKIMPLRALGVEGGWSYDIMEALRYAAGLENASGTTPAQPADIINLSFGGSGSMTSEQNFYTELHDVYNIIVIAAAGNSSSSSPIYPASYDNVVSVSAVDASRSLAYYSNYGSKVDVAAPGGGDTPDLNGDGYYDGVLSTAGNDSGISLQYTYAFFQGTSMAAPHVAGVAALMKAVYPELTPDEFDTLLSSGAITEDLGTSGRDNFYGYGLIDAYRAVAAAEDLAGGGTSTPPVLVVNPSSLNFGTTQTNLSVSVQNGGDGTLTVPPPTDDAEWLTVNGSGLGTYTVSVNRTGLAGGTYTATITFTSSENTVTVDVIMQVQAVAIKGNLGRMYIYLVDPDTQEVNPSLQTAVNASNGVYNFNIFNIPAGTYLLKGGSDPNNDGIKCDTSEACGAYLTLDQPTVITVNSNKSGLNFSANYNVSVSLGAQAEQALLK